ncbi:hypothetical protein [Bradyrhizobium sp. WSM471]|uniref:hypothetical protein n=1 Tax=Bradyrhizobium sp. WSM471 TaxID=319017 RepID=UPI0012F8B69F|nr:MULTISPECIES: hypothetical protein [Bradyrhizobium]UFW43420.1 hypothetical protein BcanWSM471_10190 [Bradyrhizobium canariense]
MPFEKLSDHYIKHMYESIRDQVRADAKSGRRLMGEPARARAKELRREIDRRASACAMIVYITTNRHTIEQHGKIGSGSEARDLCAVRRCFRASGEIRRPGSDRHLRASPHAPML